MQSQCQYAGVTGWMERSWSTCEWWQMALTARSKRQREGGREFIGAPARARPTCGCTRRVSAPWPAFIFRAKKLYRDDRNCSAVSRFRDTTEQRVSSSRCFYDWWTRKKKKNRLPKPHAPDSTTSSTPGVAPAPAGCTWRPSTGNVAPVIQRKGKKTQIGWWKMSRPITRWHPYNLKRRISVSCCTAKDNWVGMPVFEARLKRLPVTAINCGISHFNRGLKVRPFCALPVPRCQK